MHIKLLSSINVSGLIIEKIVASFRDQAFERIISRGNKFSKGRQRRQVWKCKSIVYWARKLLHSVSKEIKRRCHMVTEFNRASPTPKTKQNMKMLIKGCWRQNFSNHNLTVEEICLSLRYSVRFDCPLDVCVCVFQISSAESEQSPWLIFISRHWKVKWYLAELLRHSWGNALKTRRQWRLATR